MSARYRLLNADTERDRDVEDNRIETIDFHDDVADDAESITDDDPIPQALDEETARAIEEESDAHVGVAKVEAAGEVYGKRSRMILFVSLGLAAYIYSLDASTTDAYLTFAASAFGQHALISSIQVCKSVTVAIGKPVIAKVADVTSRATAYLGVLILYVIGYTAIATAPGISFIIVGIVIYAIGATGLQLLTQIIIADHTSLAYRGLVNSLSMLPFILNGFVGPAIASAVIKHFAGDTGSVENVLRVATSNIIAAASSSSSFILDDNNGAPPNPGSGLRKGNGWRWGYAMFAVLVPLCLAPLVFTLFWAERRAARLGIVQAKMHARTRSRSRPDSLLGSTSASTSRSTLDLHSLHKHEPLQGAARRGARTFLTKARRIANQMDLLGLVLLGSAIALILLPLTLSSKTGLSGWRSGFLPYLLAFGLILMVAFCVWDFRYASRPVIALRFIRNRSVILAGLVGFFDFMSYFLTFMYLYTFVLVVKPWTLLQSTYFVQIQTIVSTLSGFVAGMTMLKYRRYKWILIGGLIIRVIGVTMMVHSRGANGSTFELIMTQVMQGFGGGFAAVAAMVGAQASVPHADVAMATAFTLLFAEIGGAMGSAIAGAIWSSTMPSNLAKYLPNLSPAERDELFGDISSVIDLPRGSAIREGVVLAYDETMKVMIIGGIILSIAPLFTSLFMPDWYLGDKQNAVEDVDDEDEDEDPLLRVSRSRSHSRSRLLSRPSEGQQSRRGSAYVPVPSSA